MVKVPQGGVVDDRILEMLEGSIKGAVPGKVSIFPEQLIKRGSQGGQAWDEGTEVHYHA